MPRPDGDAVAAGNFAAAEFPAQLREHADFYFWITSVGRATAGMPAFGSSLTQLQIWQTLTFILVTGPQSHFHLLP